MSLYKFSQKALLIVEDAKKEAEAQNAFRVGTEHLLLALSKAGSGIAQQTLALMKINPEQVAKEIYRFASSTTQPKSEDEGKTNEARSSSQELICVLASAEDQARYFGQPEVNSEHLLLGLCQVGEAKALRIFEELGADLLFLKQQVIRLMARHYFQSNTAPVLRESLVSGLGNLIMHNLEAANALSLLAQRSGFQVPALPEQSGIVHMVFIAYVKDFLSNQVAFQRYLLQESLNSLVALTGNLDEELIAQLVSQSAQHLRFEVQNTIEYLWSHEYRLLSQVLSDAEYDLLGAAIEDLFWAHSEELALQELYDKALEDHRRKHVLSLQKKRLETATRIRRLEERLADTIDQCFLKQPRSA